MNYSKTIRQSIFGIVIIISAFACTHVTKKQQIELLKKEKAELEKQIVAMEQDIMSQDTTTQRMKEVLVEVVKTRPFDFYIQTQGRVVADDNTNVSAKAMGVITNVYVKEGDVVKKGQVLAQIDHAMIEKSVEEVKTNVALATTVFERQKNLWSQNIGTEIQFLQAKANKESLEKRMSMMQEQLNMYRIVAPISGSIDAVNINVGESVNPLTPPFVITNQSNLKVVMRVSEAYSTQIKKGNTVIVTFANEKLVKTKVTFVGQTIDVNSRTFPVEVWLTTSMNIRPNMTALVRVVYQTNPTAVCMPVNIVQEVNGQKIVYVAEHDGKNWVARKRNVEINGVFGNVAQVVKGIQVGDRIITVGYQSLNDGDLVKI